MFSMQMNTTDEIVTRPSETLIQQTYPLEETMPEGGARLTEAQKEHIRKKLKAYWETRRQENDLRRGKRRKQIGKPKPMLDNQKNTGAPADLER
jgi:hypothetical protein